MNIARLEEPGSTDARRAVITLAWQARESLGDAERRMEASLLVRTMWCKEAASFLEASIFLMSRAVSDDACDSRHARSIELLRRAGLAARAAIENGHIADSYLDSADNAQASNWDREHVSKAISIFKRAAEAGRRETHRALAELCELFPDAVVQEELDAEPPLSDQFTTQGEPSAAGPRAQERRSA